jgi:hypothetical protein
VCRTVICMSAVPLACFVQIVTDIFAMPRMYWIVCLTCGLGFPSIGSLSDIAPAYLSRYNMMKDINESQQIQNLGTEVVWYTFPHRSLTACGWLNRVRCNERCRDCFCPICWLASGSCSQVPLVHGFVDDGCRSHVCVGCGVPRHAPAVHDVGCLAQVPACLPLFFFDSRHCFTSSSWGCVPSLAFFAAGIWPTVSLLVAHDQQGTAFGLFVAIQNAGNGAGAAVVSAMQPPRCHDSFRCSTAIMAVMAGLAALFGFLVVIPRRKASIDATIIESDSGGLAAPLLMDECLDDEADIHRNTDFADRVAQRVMSDDSHDKSRRRTETKSKSTGSRRSRASIGLGNGVGFFVLPTPEP